MGKHDCCDEKEQEHPDHSPTLNRLSRAQGQIAGVEKMIQDRRYCPDILIQLRAAGAALRAVESAILETHLRGCVRTAMASKKEAEIEKKIQEILDLTMKR